jgi:transcriptional antiterminator NusG
MFRWYVVNTYSGHEKKVLTNLEHRRKSLGQEHAIRRIVVPTEMQVETKDGQKVQVEKRVLPGYVLVQMDANAETVTLVRNTPGVTGFVGMTGGGGAIHMPVPLSQAEVDSILHTAAAAGEVKQKAKAEFTLGEAVKITSGPLSDFDGEIIEINQEAGKLKVHVSIFERQVPVELKFDEVKKLD